MRMPMPGYLLLDLIGKFLVLFAVGWQFLVFLPAAERTQAIRFQQMEAMIDDLHKRTFDPPIATEQYQSSQRDMVAKRRNIYSQTKNMVVDQSFSSGMYRLVLIGIFVIGSILTILGTWLEKRNKPAT